MFLYYYYFIKLFNHVAYLNPLLTVVCDILIKEGYQYNILKILIHKNIVRIFSAVKIDLARPVNPETQSLSCA